MNNQEALNKMWDWFVVQQKPKAKENGACQYRSPDSACAVGCLVPDELYTPKLEGLRIDQLMNGPIYTDEAQKVVNYLSDLDLRFLVECQTLHDHGTIMIEKVDELGNPYGYAIFVSDLEGPKPANFVETMKFGLKNIAKRYNLTVPEEA